MSKQKVSKIHTVTNCDVCLTVLRDDYQMAYRKRVILHEPIIHFGNGKHKCKRCFNRGFKNRWKIVLDPLERVRKERMKSGKMD